jgi:hypothetical protein
MRKSRLTFESEKHEERKVVFLLSGVANVAEEAEMIIGT